MSDHMQDPSTQPPIDQPTQGPSPLEIQTQVDQWEREASEAEARAKEVRAWRTQALTLYVQLHGSVLPDGRKIARVRHGFRLEAPKGVPPPPPASFGCSMINGHLDSPSQPAHFGDHQGFPTD